MDKTDKTAQIGKDGDFEKLKTEFERIRAGFETYYEVRDSLIKDSRDIVRLSKKIIYNCHRNNIEEAEKDFTELEDKTERLVGNSEKNARNTEFPGRDGYAKSAVQEYVEARAVLSFVMGKNIPSKPPFIDSESYIMGLCDASGELLRLGVNNAVTNRDFFIRCYTAVSFLHDQLMLFDFPNSELRRKFDTLKYAVKKLSDIKLEIELKNGLEKNK